MSDIPVQLVIAAFKDVEGAEKALQQVKQDKSKRQGIQAAVAMVKDATGNKISYKEVGMTPGKGALGGVILGATVGILTGGATIVLGAAGALIGGLVGRKKQESRFASNRINQVATSLPPNSSAILAVVEDERVPTLGEELEVLGADVMTAPISADLAEQLQTHRDEAYSTLKRELDSPIDTDTTGNEATE
ncbi:MAG: DUF1269 domain-containing protein [Anaerolineae bacterium]|nr:DUF1269 domain-containing protein [Anaerolineae bacterium]